VLEEDGAREVAVELWSASKIYGMAGWRIGFLAGAAELVGRVRTLVEHTTAGVFTAVQRGRSPRSPATRAMSRGGAAVYAARRDRLVAILRSAGVTCRRPRARSTCGGSCRRPRRGHPPRRPPRRRRAGRGLRRARAGHVRLSLAVSDEELDEGARRLAAATTGAPSP
jgi:aspartate/methionine/tyrosine aminotransferase